MSLLSRKIGTQEGEVSLDSLKSKIKALDHQYDGERLDLVRRDDVLELVGALEKTFIQNLEKELRRMFSEDDTQMILSVVEEVLKK